MSRRRRLHIIMGSRTEPDIDSITITFPDDSLSDGEPEDENLTESQLDESQVRCVEDLASEFTE